MRVLHTWLKFRKDHRGDLLVVSEVTVLPLLDAGEPPSDPGAPSGPMSCGAFPGTELSSEGRVGAFARPSGSWSLPTPWWADHPTQCLPGNEGQGAYGLMMSHHNGGSLQKGKGRGKG